MWTPVAAMIVVPFCTWIANVPPSGTACWRRRVGSSDGVRERDREERAGRDVERVAVDRRVHCDARRVERERRVRR